MRTVLRLLSIAGLVALGPSVSPAAPTAPPLVPLKMQQSARAVFPQRLMDEGVTQGEARLVLEVDAAGALTDCLTVGYSRAEFAAEAERVVRHWKFAPTFLGGKPIATHAEITFEFRINGVLVRQVWFDQANPDDPREQAKLQFRARTLAELDRVPRAVATESPLALVDAQGRRLGGRVVVKFYIDAAGRPRLPQVVSADHSAMGRAALNAVEQWKFEPPLHEGRPTLAVAQQSFVWPGETR